MVDPNDFLEEIPETHDVLEEELEDVERHIAEMEDKAQPAEPTTEEEE